MPILTVVLILVIIGFILFLVNKYIPMDPMIKNVLFVIVFIVVIVWLVQLLVPGIAEVRIGG
jgi:hypothetical protein